MDSGWRSGCWLGVYPPNADAAAGLHPLHRRLLSEFGGIKETWVVDWETEFISYLDNLNWALGERETLKGATGEEGSNVREAAEFYEEMCADQEVDPVLDVRDYRCFAQEANGDWYLYQKQTSELLLVSHDLGFDFVEPKQPLEDTRLDLPVYRFKELNTLTEWVERVARQWLGHIDVSSAGGT